MTEDLTRDDLKRITKATQTAAQRRVLDEAGIFYIVCLDGSITTTWYHVNHPRMQHLPEEPNWRAARR